MTKAAMGFLLCLIGSLFLGDRVEAQSEPFYKGKTLRVIVGFSPGGAYDIGHA